MGPFAFRFISGRYTSAEFPLPDSGEMVVGRSNDVDLVLSEEMVSRKHARLNLDSNAITLIDLGSTNGTYVNGEKIKRFELGIDDRVLIGTSILKVVASSSIELPREEHDDLDAVRQRMEDIAEQNVDSITMTGTLSEVPLPDLLQLFSSNRRSGVLQLDHEGQTGRIYLREGEVEFAEIGDAEDISPLKAFYRLVGWANGDFSLEELNEDIVFENPLTQPAEHLIMEATRQVDENRQLLASLPAPDAPLTWSIPMMPRLAQLSPVELEVLQDLLNFGCLEDTLDASTETDHVIYTTLQKLLKLGYLEVEDED